MRIDVLLNTGTFLMSYLSTMVPRVGETITTKRPECCEFTVLDVNYLVSPTSAVDIHGQELITLVVQEKNLVLH